MKKYKEEIEESKIIVEEDNMEMISTLLKKHLFLYVEFPFQIEIAVHSKSMMKITKMSNLYIEENVLFAYRVPDNLSNGRNSIQKMNAKQLSHHSKHPSGVPGNNDNSVTVPIIQFSSSSQTKTIAIPNKESIHEPQESNTKIKSESFISNNYKLLVQFWYLSYILMIVLGTLLGMFSYVIYESEPVFSFMNLMYYIIGLSYLFSFLSGIFGIKEVYLFNKEIEMDVYKNKKKSLSYLNLMIGSTIGIVFILILYGNFKWNNAVLMSYFASELYINYLCVILIFDSLVSIGLNIEMNNYKEQKIKSEELTHALLS